MKKISTQRKWYRLVFFFAIVISSCSMPTRPEITYRDVYTIENGEIITNRVLDTNEYVIVNNPKLIEKLPLGTRVIVNNVPNFGTVKGAIQIYENRILINEKVRIQQKFVVQLEGQTIQNGKIISNQSQVDVYKGIYVSIDMFFLSKYIELNLNRIINAHPQYTNNSYSFTEDDDQYIAKVLNFKHGYGNGAKLYRWKKYKNSLNNNTIKEYNLLIRSIGYIPDEFSISIPTEINRLQFKEILDYFQKWNLSIVRSSVFDNIQEKLTLEQYEEFLSSLDITYNKFYQNLYLSCGLQKIIIKANYPQSIGEKKRKAITYVVKLYSDNISIQDLKNSVLKKVGSVLNIGINTIAYSWRYCKK